VSDSGDDVPEMPTTPFLDDRAIEAIIAGDDVAAELQPLATFASGVRAEGDRHAPRPSPALAQLIATGGGPASSDVDADAHAGTSDPLSSRRKLALAKVAGLGLVAKLTLGAGAAAASVVGGGAAGVLPGKANHVVRNAIEAVTPMAFPDDDAPATSLREPAGTGGDHGDRVSSDATGESDGVPGVDGGATADDAPGASVRPSEPPGRDGAPGPSGDAGTPSVSVPDNAPERAPDGTANPRPPAAGPTAPPDSTPPSTTPAPAPPADDPPGSPRGGPAGDAPAP
jgi:hypothetical protein